MSFTVGDWVTSISWADQEPQKITKIELATSPDEEDFVFFGDNYCTELKYVEKWIPKEGEWCWFKNENDEIYSLAKFEAGDIYDSDSVIKSTQLGIHGNSYWDICRPFIGELPYES
jgi:hypothetical protein